MSPAGRLPTFFIIGAQKSGTTALAAYLEQHPGVFIHPAKEPDFFIAERAWQHGLDWYRDAFAAAGSAVALGEASTSYTMFPFFTGVPERLASVVPDARLIYLMREPVERMRSAYQHALATGAERRPIEDALLHDSRYLLPSSYAFQLEQWLPRFPRARMLLLTAEDLRHNRAETVARVFDFLGLDPGAAAVQLDREHHVSADKRAPRALWHRAVPLLRRTPPRLRRRAVAARSSGARWLTRPIAAEEVAVSDGLRDRLVAMLRPDLPRLQRIVGDGFGAWDLL